MRWELDLEAMENNIEKESEKNIEKNASYEIHTKEELLKEIDESFSAFETLKFLQEMGEDVSDAIKIANDKLKELLSYGKKMGLISIEEQAKYIAKAEEMTGLKNKQTFKEKFNQIYPNVPQANTHQPISNKSQKSKELDEER